MFGFSIISCDEEAWGNFKLPSFLPFPLTLRWENMMFRILFYCKRLKQRAEWASYDPLASVTRFGRSGRPEVWRFLTTATFSLLLLHFWVFFLCEMRHWINYVDYEGPPCSLRIIKNLGGEHCTDLPVSVWVHLGPRVGWSRESTESGVQPVSFPPWWTSLLGVQC